MKKIILQSIVILFVSLSASFSQSSKKNIVNGFKLQGTDVDVYVLCNLTNISLSNVANLLASNLFASMYLVESVSETPNWVIKDTPLAEVSLPDDLELEENQIKQLQGQKAQQKPLLVMTPSPKTVVVAAPQAEPTVATTGGIYDYVVKEAAAGVTLTEEEKKQYYAGGIRVLSLLEEAALSDSIFTKPDQRAVFHGGSDAFKKYLEKNVKASRKAQLKEKQEQVIVQFVVKKNGKPEAFKLMKMADYQSSEEVLNALQDMPNWLPAQYKGTEVSSVVEVTVPVIKR